jgi:hypothetical protein
MFDGPVPEATAHKAAAGRRLQDLVAALDQATSAVGPTKGSIALRLGQAPHKGV